MKSRHDVLSGFSIIWYAADIGIFDSVQAIILGVMSDDMIHCIRPRFARQNAIAYCHYCLGHINRRPSKAPRRRLILAEDALATRCEMPASSHICIGDGGELFISIINLADSRSYHSRP